MVHDSTTEAKKGTVLEQSPKAGSTLDKGSTVTIVVSTFEPPTPPSTLRRTDAAERLTVAPPSPVA